MKRPIAVFAVSAALIATGALGVAKSSVDPSPETYLHGTDIWENYAKIDDSYEIGETVVIAFRELGGTVFDVETVGAVAALDRALNTMPSVQRVLSIASATALDRENEVLDMTPLLRAGPITKNSALELATRIRRHPVYGEALVDAPHETTFVFVQLSQSMKDPLARVEAAREIRALADTFRSKHRTVHLAGSTLTKEAVASSLARETMIFFPIIVLLLVLSLWIIFGELVATIVPLSVIGVSTVSVIGLFAALGVRLNMTTAALPIIVLVAGLAESVHFLSELRRQHARTNDREVSLIATVEAISVPCLVTTSAAAVGFLSMAPSLVTPLRELGFAAALSLLLVYVCTMLLTPALLKTFKFPRRKTKPFASAAWIGRVLSRLALAERKKMLPTIAGLGLASGVAIAALSAVHVDSHFLGYLDEEHRLRQDVAIIERTLGGAETLELILDGKGEGFFKATEQLARIDRLKKELEGSDGIHTAFSVADYLKIANAVMTGGGEDKLPESGEAVAQLMVIDPTPFSAFTNEEMQQARMALQVNSMSSEGVLHLAEIVKAKAEHSLAGTGIKVDVTGLPMVYAKLTRYVVDDAAKRFFIAAFFVWLVMMMGLRSVAIASVAMVSTGLAAIFTVGMMAIAGIHLDANIIYVGSLALVVAVNHAVHLADRYQRAREEGSPTPDAAVTYAATHGGHPVAITSLLFMIGFSVLFLSSFTPMLHIGVLGAILVAFSLAIDLMFLPVLLETADWLENRHAAPAPPDITKASSEFRRVSSMLTSSRPASGRPAESASTPPPRER